MHVSSRVGVGAERGCGQRAACADRRADL